MEAVVLEPVVRQPFEVRCLAGAAEGARRAEAGVVDQHDQHVRRPFRRPERLDRRKTRVGALGVVGRDADVVPVGNWENGALAAVRGLGHLISFPEQGIGGSRRIFLVWRCLLIALSG